MEEPGNKQQRNTEKTLAYTRARLTVVGFELIVLVRCVVNRSGELKLGGDLKPGISGTASLAGQSFCTPLY
jgi:hypothetical protein